MKFNKLNNREDLASLMEIPLQKLTYILYAKEIDDSYTTFTIPKKSGGNRLIHSPDEVLKNIQRTLAAKLLNHHHQIYANQYHKRQISHGFEKQKSIITNAKNHLNKDIIINIDIDHFFESFHFGRVKGFFQKNKDFKSPKNIAIMLAQLTCYNGSLPQGAPTSPIIANLICNILDMRIISLVKKYKLYYTRYADDLTFSTNDHKMYYKTSTFLLELKEVINEFGLKLNDSKTRISYKNSKQEVTGITVNDKLNVSKSFIKDTRAMLDYLYKTGKFTINSEPGNLNQLEGRFSYINQLDAHNNRSKNKNGKEKIGFFNLNSREKQYQKFLFYKYFLANEKPLIITEGKTDIVYLKAALKNMYKDYPSLISKNNDNTFTFKVRFLTRTKRLAYFLNFVKDGADTIKNLYNFYSEKQNKEYYPNYFKLLKNNSVNPINPAILVFDNEISSAKPLGQFIKYIKLNKDKQKYLIKNNHVNIVGNLNILTNQLISKKEECEIEDLFDEETLKMESGGKSFDRSNNADRNKHFGKHIFAEIVYSNYNSIDFSNFRYMLDNIKSIVEDYSISK